MTKQPTRMLDDPSESAFVRDLLQAGAEDQVTDFDYSRGLTKHLTIIAAGTLLPAWAKDLVSNAAASGGASGLSVKVIAFVVGLPIVTAGVVASIILSNQAPEMRSADTAKSTPAQETQNRSPSGPQRIAPLDETITPNREATHKHNPLRSTTTAIKRRDRLSLKPTKNRIVPSIPARDRRAVGKIRSRELSPYQPVDPQFHRALEATAQPPTKSAADEQEKEKQISTTPVIERRTVSEVRQERREQARKPRVDENLFERETRMLAAANRLLESNPERSLELAKRGEREFPGSMFTEERRHVLILALIKLSRLDEARQLAGPYLHDYPKSPFAQRIRHALAKARREQ